MLPPTRGPLPALSGQSGKGKLNTKKAGTPDNAKRDQD